MTAEQTFTVVGMACGHCESFVTDELRRLDGVDSVAVDIVDDSVTVVSRHPLDPSEVIEAVERAGYELVTQASALGDRRSDPLR